MDCLRCGASVGDLQLATLAERNRSNAALDRLVNIPEGRYLLGREAIACAACDGPRLPWDRGNFFGGYSRQPQGWSRKEWPKFKVESVDSEHDGEAHPTLGTRPNPGATLSNSPSQIWLPAEILDRWPRPRFTGRSPSPLRRGVHRMTLWHRAFQGAPNIDFTAYSEASRAQVLHCGWPACEACALKTKRAYAGCIEAAGGHDRADFAYRYFTGRWPTAYQRRRWTALLSAWPMDSTSRAGYVLDPLLALIERAGELGLIQAHIAGRELMIHRAELALFVPPKRRLETPAANAESVARVLSWKAYPQFLLELAEPPVNEDDRRKYATSAVRRSGFDPDYARQMRKRLRDALRPEDLPLLVRQLGITVEQVLGEEEQIQQMIAADELAAFGLEELEQEA
jgi:hypothetical protein